MKQLLFLFLMSCCCTFGVVAQDDTPEEAPKKNVGVDGDNDDIQRGQEVEQRPDNEQDVEIINNDAPVDAKRPFSSYYHQKKSHTFNVGIGFPNKLDALFKGLDLVGITEGGKATPQLTFKYEYGLTEEMGIGLHVGYYQLQSPQLSFETSELVGLLCDIFPEGCDVINNTVSGNLKVTALSVAGRWTYHIHFLEKLDTYSSAVLGYSFLREKTTGEGITDQFSAINIPSFVYFTSVGARYYFNEHLGLYGEFGYGSITYANAGLTYRL